jgi:predicted PurR-regulated permease PerM
MQNLKLPAYIHAVFIGLLIVLVVAFMILARSFLVPMLFATYTAMLLVPFCEQLEKWKFPRALATVTGVVTALLSILGLFTFFFIQLRNFAKDLDNVQERLIELGGKVNSYLNNNLGLQTDATVFFEKARIVDLIKDNSEGIGIAILNTVGSLAGVVLFRYFIFIPTLPRSYRRIYPTNF